MAGATDLRTVGPTPDDWRAAVADLETAGTSRKAAIAEVAHAAGVPKREVYDAVHKPARLGAMSPVTRLITPLLEAFCDRRPFRHGLIRDRRVVRPNGWTAREREEPTRERAGTGEDGARRDRERPPLPEPLPHPVVDNHCHLDIADGPAEDRGWAPRRRSRRPPGSG